MSYGRFVQLCIDERRHLSQAGRSWDFAATKFANDNFGDFPEHRVIEALRKLRWPDRPVSVGEVNRWLRSNVGKSERRRWIEDLEAGRV